MTDGNGRVLVVAAHPDDPEFAAGGTIAKLVQEGREVAYVIVTDGGKGSADPGVVRERLVRRREDEQRHAARQLGVTRVDFLGYEDGEVEDTRQLRRDVAREIRRWRPALVITSHPSRAYTNFFAWHRDHRIVAGVVLDCVYPLARDPLAFPELLPDYPPHTVSEVYMIQWHAPQLIVDITATIDLKLRALPCEPDRRCHRLRDAPAEPRDRPRGTGGVSVRRGLRSRGLAGLSRRRPPGDPARRPGTRIDVIRHQASRRSSRTSHPRALSGRGAAVVDRRPRTSSVPGSLMIPVP